MGHPAHSRPDDLLVVDGLSKSYGSVQALDGVSLSVGPGEVVGLLGPNGAGKSTTIGCLSGITTSDAGQVAIAGHDPQTEPQGTKRCIGVATQRTALYPDLTVERNLRFFGLVSGGEPDQVDQAIVELTEQLDLAENLSRRARDLSVGQQRLAHVAAAMVHDPPLLILDEPTAGLDVGARTLLLDTLRKRTSSGERALLYSSHYLQEVEDLCPRVVVINRGRVIASGQVRDLIGAHGAGRVEVVVGEDVVIHPGTDVGAAVEAAQARGRIDEVRVVRPSLEAVFIQLTGERIEELNEQQAEQEGDPS